MFNKYHILWAKINSFVWKTICHSLRATIPFRYWKKGAGFWFEPSWTQKSSDATLLGCPIFIKLFCKAALAYWDEKFKVTKLKKKYIYNICVFSPKFRLRFESIFNIKEFHYYPWYLHVSEQTLQKINTHLIFCGKCCQTKGCR